MIKRKLIRSQALINNLGQRTGKYNWTECFYLWGILLRSTQIKNLGYEEIVEVFNGNYSNSLFHDYNTDKKLWYQALTYTPNKKANEAKG